MKKDRFKLITVVNFIIEKKDKILLMKRSDGFFKGGFWVLPPGHIESNETAREATVRELKEELNIIVKEEDLEYVHTMHSITPFLERIDLFFKIKKFIGDICNKENDKCDELKYFDYGKLPPEEKMSSTTLQVIEAMKNKEYYSERGFKEKNKGFSELDKFSFDTFYNLIEKEIEDKKEANLENIVDESLKFLKNKKNIDREEFLKIATDIIVSLSVVLQKNNTDLREILYNYFNR